MWRQQRRHLHLHHVQHLRRQQPDRHDRRLRWEQRLVGFGQQYPCYWRGTYLHQHLHQHLQITCIFTCTYIHTYAYINTLTNSKMILLTLTFEQLWAMRKSRLIGSLPFQCYFDVHNALNGLKFSDHVHQRSDWSTLVQRLHQLHHSSGPWRQELHQGDHEPSNQLRLQRHLAPSQHHGILLNWKFVVWEVSKVNHLLIRG